jgi:CRISPR/Cas system-associated exonuclease Cas4 (RecB family)
MRTVRASEIGVYLYCRRAWWYQRQGKPNENQAELLAGRELHAQHGRQVITSGCLRLAAYAMLLLALALAAAYLTHLMV